MTVLDVSNWDYETFDAACLKAAGVTGIILGCQDQAKAREMAARCQAVGLPILATYAFLYFGLPEGVGPQVVRAYEVAGDFRVPYVALDVEARPPNEAQGQTPATRTDQLRHAIRIVEQGGKKPIIYTREEYWRREMANTAEFARYPLWVAHYGTNDPANPRGPLEDVDFGGWRRVAIHQYSSTIVVCGRARDHNYLIDFGGEMQDPRVDTILKALGDVDGWVGRGNIPLMEAFARDQNWIQSLANLLAAHIQGDAEENAEVARALRELADEIEGTPAP